jgi:hypothetical protein
MSAKLVASWVLGGVLILFGTWIVQNLQLTIGVSGVSYVLAMIIALILFLVAGLLWISVAVATRHGFK